MKLFKSLLLASATGMVAVSGASAADLGAKKPSPVEYVRACYNPLWGTSGGFVIPGGQTCLRVGGQARFDIGYGQTYQRNANNQGWGYRGGGNIFLDAITPSEYGNVRAFVNMSLVYRTGSQRTGTGARWGQSIDASAVGGVNGPVAGIAAGTDFSGSSAFIQFAGFTFGRTSSFYNTLGLAPSIIGWGLGAGVGNVNQVAYTANLGNGFLATVALEDPTTRRNGIGFLNAAGFLPGAPAAALIAGGANSANSGYAQHRMPNIVAALRFDQAWGSAELSGIVSEVRTNSLTVPNLVTGVREGFASTKYGFSVSGGLKINLPMIAAGDALFLNATYSDGMINSVVGNFFGASLTGITAFGAMQGIGAFDAVTDPVSGASKTTKAWGVNAGFQHFWTPTFATSITGSYGQVDHGISSFLNLARGTGDYNIWTVGVLNTWTPVRGLTFGLDLGYVNIDPKGRLIDGNKTGSFTGANTAFTPAAGPGLLRSKSSDGQFQARFRVIRDF